MNQDEKLLNGLKQVVLENLENEQFSVEHLSQLIGVSRSHLHRKLKKLKGQSISQFIREVRLAEALKLLRLDVATTSEIAFKVGFNSPSYFHKCFLEYYGYPPSEAKHLFQKPLEDEKTDIDTATQLEVASGHSLPDDPKDEIKQSSFNKKWLVISIIGLALSISLIFYFWNKSGNTISLEKSIAVLPFNSLSTDEANQHFADGLVEDLLSRLATIGEFKKVISRTSSDTYRERGKKTVREIASELGVSYIVEGSVQKYENKARITVQLIDAKNDDHIWNETYDRDLTDLFTVQSEIAVQVATELSAELTSQQTIDLRKNQTENVKAFEAYQLGRYYWGKRKFEEYEKAIHFFEEAIAEDKNYALAYAGLADTYFLMNWHFSDVEEIMRYRDKAEEYALKALEIDERLAEAHTVLATLYFFIDWDWANAEKIFLKALKLNPNYSTLHHRYAEHLSQTGRHKEAREHMNKAIELDPLSYVIRRNSTALYFYLGQLEKSMAEAQLSEELGDGNDTPAWYKFVINFALDDGPATLASLKKLQSYDNDNFSEPVLDSIYQASGKEGLMRLRIEATPSARGKAELYAILGENDQAVNWLETALAEGDRMADVACLYSPNGLHSNPRYIALLKKMNLPWSPEPAQ
jgi:TolB-like protein/AraC-like DNA-binding protein